MSWKEQREHEKKMRQLDVIILVSVIGIVVAWCLTM